VEYREVKEQQRKPSLTKIEAFFSLEFCNNHHKDINHIKRDKVQHFISNSKRVFGFYAFFSWMVKVQRKYLINSMLKKKVDGV